MRKNILIFILLIFLSIIFSADALAIVDPGESVNNRYGIHIIDENDLELAAELVNSSGGEWGYVTLVIREDDRNPEKWQAIFDRMRELKLIPLLRLATKTENNGWAKPQESDVDSWVNFLANLNWVIRNRYIILFNEPNHANEWGGEVKPDEYARIVALFQKSLKEKSEDFFLLSAGFDASVPTSATSMDMYRYFKLMYQADEQIFTRFDGWSSHSYPNPGFSSLPSFLGKTGVKSFFWETDYLHQYKLRDNIPIFITETGWQHQEGIQLNSALLSAEEVSPFYQSAFTNIWSPAQIIAVTPFVLRYLAEPFDHFSWIMPDSSGKYPQYDLFKEIPKPKGVPIQIHSAETITAELPAELIINSDYRFNLRFKNTGQSIWDSQNLKLKVSSSFPLPNIAIGDISSIPPFSVAELSLSLHTPSAVGLHNLDYFLECQSQPITGISENQLTLIAPPSLLVKAQVWMNSQADANDLTLLIYDNGTLIKKYAPFSLLNGKGYLKELYDLLPRQEYRFVLLKPHYLPRQEISVLAEDQTTLTFKRLLPLDFNNDGKFSFFDLLDALAHPLKTIRLLLPF